MYMILADNIIFASSFLKKIVNKLKKALSLLLIPQILYNLIGIKNHEEVIYEKDSIFNATRSNYF